MVHANRLCDGCKQSPLAGMRWHCLDCRSSSYDLCTKCYMADCHDLGHDFERISDRWERREIIQSACPRWHRGLKYLTALQSVTDGQFGHQNSVNVGIKFHLEWKLCFSCAQFTLLQWTIFSISIEASYWVFLTWLKREDELRKLPLMRRFVQ